MITNTTLFSLLGLIIFLLFSFRNFFLHFRLINIFFIPIRFIQLFKNKKAKRFWGVVYNSQTGESLDPVFIYLEDMTGKRIASTWTDILGRYGFRVEKGIYRLFAKKRKYIFPSANLWGKNHDDIYENIYTGSEIVVNDSEQDLKFNIPLDPIESIKTISADQKRSKTQFFLVKEKWWRRFSNLIFILGFIFVLFEFTLFFDPIQGFILGFYFLIIILRLLKVFYYPKKGWVGLIDGEPASFAILKVYLAGTMTEIIRAVTDQYGRYYLPVPNGIYFIKIIARTKAGYLPVLTSNPIVVENKLITQHFNI